MRLYSVSRDLVLQLFMRALWIPEEKDPALQQCLDKFLGLAESAGLAPEHANRRWAGHVLMDLVSQSPSAWFDRPFGFACLASSGTGELVRAFYGRLLNLERNELERGYRKRCPRCERSYPTAAVNRHQRQCRVRHVALEISVECLHEEERERMNRLKQRLDQATGGNAAVLIDASPGQTPLSK